MKRVYTKVAQSMDIIGCTSCVINRTFKEFKDDADDLTPAEIQDILNSNLEDMSIKKAKKKTVDKKATTAVVKKKVVAKVNKPKVTVVKKAAKKIKDINVTPTLPGGLKFLYIPKK
jgi:hypothetical protein